MWHRIIITKGIVILFLLFPTTGRSEQVFSSFCPALPQQGVAGTVSVHVAQATLRSDVLCVRAFNRSQEAITTAETAVKLQRWTKEEGSDMGQFRDFQRQGCERTEREMKVLVPAGGAFDVLEPLHNPVPVGQYRLCVSYTAPGQAGVRDACSEEFPLPLPDCPSLPRRGPVNIVSVYIAGALDAVCVRVFNGFPEAITTGEAAISLQVWTEEGREKKTLFRDVLERKGFRTERKSQVYVPAGGAFDLLQPLPSRVPAGQYRLCVRYRPLGQSSFQDSCSEEFSLPLPFPGCPLFPQQGPAEIVSITDRSR